MLFDYTAPASVVHLRGEFKRDETHVRESFTESELDVIAPLAPGEQNSLGENCSPVPGTIDRIQQRIEAARMLKYGSSEKDES